MKTVEYRVWNAELNTMCYTALDGHKMLYTGKRDQDNNKVFEEDFIRFNWRVNDIKELGFSLEGFPEEVKDKMLESDGREFVGMVVWNHITLMFEIIVIDEDFFPGKGFTFPGQYICVSKVVGNRTEGIKV